jgi:hypothetical protein
MLLLTACVLNLLEFSMFKKLGLSLAAFSPLAALAAVPAGVSTAITDAGVDAATVGALVLVVLVGIAAFKYMRRAM